MPTLNAFTESTVGQLAAEMPASIRVFEAWKIDYCCGGRTPLSDACAAAGKSVDDFAIELERAAMSPDAAHDWPADTLGTMAQNIVSMYHQYTRAELQTIAPIAAKVLGVHGERRPELAEVAALVNDLTNDMLPHMLKEEQVLFPYVAQLETAVTSGAAAPTPFFGTVKNPVRMMMLEHDRVGDLLARLRVVTDNYTPPSSACFSYRELYRRLADLEARTHEHIHVENNIYFPRAVSLEDEAGSAASFAFSGGTCGSSCGH
ncbi:MAG TPA: iron-sulfur cluster repair di-iron protein [Thermoanaerobaculia bacterium]|nr:iron-sulfur cluster repair di-iron protein [Thermoanaerobaculia bacterium]